MTSDEPHPARTPDRARWRSKALVAGAALAFLTLAGTALIDSISDTPGALGAPTGRGSATTVPLAPAPPGQPTRADRVWRGSSSWDRPIWPIPTRVRMPSVGVDAAVVAVDVASNGELGIPDEPRMLGWWQQGAHPDGPGAVVIAGHVDTAKDGPGALFRLAQAQPGQPVTLETNLGPRRYVVTDIHHYAKTALPALTFTTTGPPHLVLITCGGVFNTFTHQYDDNIVVSANPA
jgi:sortase family protein